MWWNRFRSMPHNPFVKIIHFCFQFISYCKQMNNSTSQYKQQCVFDAILMSLWNNNSRITWDFLEVFYQTKFSSFETSHLIKECFPPFTSDGLSMPWSMNWNSVQGICQPRTCTRCPLVKWSSFCWIFFSHSSRGGNEMCGFVAPVLIHTKLLK